MKKSRLSLFILLGCSLWAYALRGFLFGDLALASDANAYYEHFKYYFDQIGRGVFPLWEPNRVDGVSIEFFLRRIDEFNPFHYILPLLARVTGEFIRGYRLYLGAYYLAGMTGF